MMCCVDYLAEGALHNYYYHFYNYHYYHHYYYCYYYLAEGALTGRWNMRLPLSFAVWDALQETE